MADKKVRIERSVSSGKTYDHVQIIEFHQPKATDDFPLFDFLGKELMHQADCSLFLWDSLAKEPSKEFFQQLQCALSIEPAKCGIVLNRVHNLNYHLNLG